MGRWQPGARGRLMRSALELFSEQGFENTTAIEVAERAGVTERTFYRHFADKREVLFLPSTELQDVIIAAIAGAPSVTDPIEAVVAALEAGAAVLEDREYSRTRAKVIAANTSLQERELLKLSRMAAAVREALRDRGVADIAATIAADSGVTLFRIGFENWIDDSATRSLAEYIREASVTLRTLANPL